MRDRLKLWHATWRVIAAHPLLGVGLDNLWPALVRYGYRLLPKAPRHVPRRKFLRAHSAPLHILATTGILGGSVALWTLATIARGGFSDRAAFRSAIAGYLVALLVGFHSPATAALAAVLAGALVGLGG